MLLESRDTKVSFSCDRHLVLMIFNPLTFAEGAAIINVSKLCLGFAAIEGRKEAPIGRDGFLTADSIKAFLVRWKKKLLL